MPMVKILNSYGEAILVHIEEEAIQKLPKNAKRKLLKHGKIGKVTYKRIFNEAERVVPLTATAKGNKGISGDYYHYFDSHNQCRNPLNVLIQQGLLT